MTEFALEPLDVRHVGPLRELYLQPGVLEWWGPLEENFPFDEPESTRYAIVVDAEIVGLVQWGEETEPDHRHAYIDIFIGDDHTGRGLGTEVMRHVVRMLIDDHGHHRIVIDPAVENERAIRCYEKAGFKPVGIMHGSYRLAGEWRDDYFMEIVTPPVSV